MSSTDLTAVGSRSAFILPELVPDMDRDDYGESEAARRFKERHEAEHALGTELLRREMAK